MLKVFPSLHPYPPPLLVHAFLVKLISPLPSPKTVEATSRPCLELQDLGTTRARAGCSHLATVNDKPV